MLKSQRPRALAGVISGQGEGVLVRIEIALVHISAYASYRPGGTARTGPATGVPSSGVQPSGSRGRGRGGRLPPSERSATGVARIVVRRQTDDTVVPTETERR